MKLIDKDVLVAEIERLKDFYNRFDDNIQSVAKYNVLIDILSFMDTLEVKKEVDLEKEIKHFTMSKELYEADSVIKAVAEHFFELGLKCKSYENK